MADKRWKSISASRFPWEQEALDFIHAGFPAQDNYVAWSNFEFLADDGSINEVDLLVACPQGIFLIEIKSKPGIVSGDAQHWVWEHDGIRRNDDSPLILADRKCKRLKSLLTRQRAFRNIDCPFIEPLVFLSHSEVRLQLHGVAASRVCLRDRPAESGRPERPGILAAIRRRECPGLQKRELPVARRPQIRAFAQAMEQAGIRPRQSQRRVGDFVIEQLIFESPTGAYQDWQAHHVSHTSTRRVARIYQVARQAGPEEREILRSAARREFQVLEMLDHPGILRADAPTECEFGPVLFLRAEPDAQRLDHFMQLHGRDLAVDHRLSMLRQIADTIRYAHSRHVIHRSLSPQSVYVRRQADGTVAVQICNWQTSARLLGSTTGQGTRISATVHASQLVEDASLAYLAPETLTGGADGGPALDIFSLGALAYLLFTGKPPAASQADLQEKLRAAGGLDIRESLDGAVEALVDLVQFSAIGDVSLRHDIDQFLAHLEQVEEQLTRPEVDTVNPLQATIGSRLENGFVVVKKLGSGATATAFLVERQSQTVVLKVARSADLNGRIKREFELLKRLDWPQIVSAMDLYEFGELQGFTMELAGEATLARELRQEGALDLTMLKQFGEDLLRAIQYLDKHGIAHRDIKPENIGIRTGRTKKRKELCLFDFSLAGTSPDNIRVGTPPYLDPFLCERKVRRWDTNSELFAAAMTLHEMATGVLPKWGDGRTEPSLTKGEVKLVGELFPAGLRERFSKFFEKALRRDYSQRFDNAADMLEAWSSLFETIDSPTRLTATTADATDEETAFILPERLTFSTQLVLFGLSTRLSNALDRLNVNTVAELLHYPLMRIYKLSGVGHKTRRELGELCKQLRDRLPPGQTPELEPEEALSTAESVDALARQVVGHTRGGKVSEEHAIIRTFLEWQVPREAPVSAWPSQSDVATLRDVSRQRVGQAITAGRRRWNRFPTVTALREDILQFLRGLGGIATHSDIIQAVLAARGSALDEPARRRMASVAVRAALETEKAAADPRFDEYRSGDRIYLAVHPDLKGYALRLGQQADRLADENPLPAPSRVLEVLHDLTPPSLPVDVVPPADTRLVQLAVAASDHAACNTRLEIYPRGLAAERALALAQGALVCPPGGALTVEELRRNVASRYPEAQPLPDRPDLDRLLEGLSSDLRWNDSAAGGRGGYQPTYRESPSFEPSPALATRLSTHLTIQPGADVTPDVADARSLEEKLRYAASHGAFLVLSVEPQWLGRAREELARRFPISVCDLDAVFLQTLREEADRKRARWDVVLRADAAPTNTTDWRNLQRLVEAALPRVESCLRSRDQTRLVVNPGLLARYDRLNLLAQLAQDVGRTDGIHGLWLLVPANDQSPLPVLNRKPIPITNAAQHARLTEAWLSNRHRAAVPMNAC
jgi:serine/threonine protein kinase